MPGVKRSSLQSTNPVKYVHDDGVAIDMLEETLPTSALTKTAQCVHAAPSSPNAAEDVQEGADAGHAAATAMIAWAPTSALEHQTAPPSADRTGLPSSVLLSPASVNPRSPSANRERFLKGFLPARTCCNLDLCKASPGTKFNLVAVCIAVFPATTNPDRRYIQMADSTGSVGVSVWNHNVHMFSSASVGRLVSLGKVLIGSHNNRKQLTMARDSTVQLMDDEQHIVSSWWKGLLDIPPHSCGSAHDVSDNSIIAVCGILGMVSVEVKMVNNVPKNLLSLHLVDASGKIDIRSWNHAPEAFADVTDRPILIRRVRVTSFAGTKLCELLDGAGSVLETKFPGAQALEKFWAS